MVRCVLANCLLSSFPCTTSSRVFVLQASQPVVKFVQRKETTSVNEATLSSKKQHAQRTPSPQELRYDRENPEVIFALPVIFVISVIVLIPNPFNQAPTQYVVSIDPRESNKENCSATSRNAPRPISTAHPGGMYKSSTLPRTAVGRVFCRRRDRGVRPRSLAPRSTRCARHAARRI